MAKKLIVPASYRDSIRERMEQHTDAFIQSGICKWQHMGDENTPSGKAVPCRYNWDQQQIMRIRRHYQRCGKPLRGLLGKSRQRGVSTSNVYRAHASCAAVNGRKTVFVAHRQDRAIAFQDKVRFMRNHWPEWFRDMFPLKHDNDFKMSFHWDSIQWIMSVIDVRSVEFARGETPHEVLGTEWTRWPRFEFTLTEVMSACHLTAGTVGLFESTLKGRGSEQQDFWDRSKKGLTGWEAIWLSWINDPATHLNCHLWSEQEQHRRMMDVFEYGDMGKELIRRGLQYGLSVGQVWQSFIWLKDVKNGNWDLFLEDYPIIDEEGWRALGYLYFEENELIAVSRRSDEIARIVFELGLRDLEDGFEKIKYLTENPTITHESDLPHIVIYEMPNPQDEYVIGAWPTGGTVASMPSSAHGINKYTGAMMFSVHGKIKPHQLANVLSSIGKIYNDAVIAPEARTAEGIACISQLVRLNYPRLYRWKAFDDLERNEKSKTGWWTTSYTSNLTLTLLARVLEHAAIADAPIHKKLIRDMGVIAEMMNFIEDQETGLPMAAAGGSDTRIVSLAIAWYVADMETRGHDKSPVNSLRPCQILTSGLTIRKERDVTSIIQASRDFISQQIGSFHEQEESFPFFGQ